MDLSEDINWIRRHELATVSAYFTAGARILEIGAGSGQQALELTNLGFAVEAVDLSVSDYAGLRIFPVIDYDGRTLPFEDDSFDIVFSSNVLEHVRDLASMHSEIQRVLRPGGYCIHVVPTAVWRFWTLVSGPPAGIKLLARARDLRGLMKGLRTTIRGFLPPRHGERGNAVSELIYFRTNWWRTHFDQYGFKITAEAGVGLFYSGNAVFGAGLSIKQREAMARRLGSVTHLFRLEAARASLYTA